MRNSEENNQKVTIDYGQMVSFYFSTFPPFSTSKCFIDPIFCLKVDVREL